MTISREQQRQLEKINDILENIKSVELIGLDGLDIYLEPSAFPQMAAELALAIKPVLIKHRDKINLSTEVTKVGI